jgi:hypothetical protein
MMLRFDTKAQRIALIACFLLFLSRLSPAQAPLSADAEISLLTGSPGNALYTTFGHSAIRVRDPHQSLDLVFNYGTFDFSTPNFYMKFLRGKLDYMLSVESFERFQLGYYYGNQWVIEQVLGLDSVQKQTVFNHLAINYRPENRYYKYDFFFDNCATRIRDLFDNSLGDRLISRHPERWTSQPATFRTLLRHYLTGWQMWSGLGIDIILGMPTDRAALPDEYLFLPDFMAETYRLSQVITETGEAQNYVKNEETIITNRPKPDPPGFLMPRPVTWMLLAAIGLLTALGFYLKKPLRAIDVFLFGLAGAIGALIVFLWFFTEHSATKNNLNILWAWPSHLPLLFLFFRSGKNVFFKRYLLAYISILAVLLGSWAWLPQHLNPALIPILILLILRSALHLYIYPFQSSNKNAPGSINN